MYFYAQKTELILSSSLNYDALSSSESSARDPEKSQVNNAVKKNLQMLAMLLMHVTE